MGNRSVLDYFTTGAPIQSEGARCGLVTCLRCGAALLLDERDGQNPLAVHMRWHDEQQLPTEERSRNA